jgi:hypothetical protein
VLEQELERLVEGDPSAEDDGQISRRRYLLRSLLDGIEAGDPRLAKLLLDRIWPEPRSMPGFPQHNVVIQFYRDDEMA